MSNISGSVAIKPYSRPSSLVEGLPDDLREAVYRTGVKVTHGPGKTIHLAGDDTAALSIITKGSVKISRCNAHGREVATVILRAGESFGELPLLTGAPRTHDATAVSDVELVQISRMRFFRLLDDEPRLRDHLLRSLSLMLMRTLDLLDDERRHPVTMRVAKFLLAYCKDDMDCQTISVRQSEIAEAISVSRPSVNLALKELNGHGLIKTNYGEIQVTNVPHLEHWISDSMS